MHQGEIVSYSNSTRIGRIRSSRGGTYTFYLKQVTDSGLRELLSKGMQTFGQPVEFQLGASPYDPTDTVAVGVKSRRSVRKGISMVEQAERALHRGDLDTAERLFARALDEGAQEIKSYQDFASLLIERKRPAQAAKLLQKVQDRLDLSAQQQKRIISLLASATEAARKLGQSPSLSEQGAEVQRLKKQLSEAQAETEAAKTALSLASVRQDELAREVEHLRESRRREQEVHRAYRAKQETEAKNVERDKRKLEEFALENKRLKATLSEMGSRPQRVEGGAETLAQLHQVRSHLAEAGQRLVLDLLSYQKILQVSPTGQEPEPPLPAPPLGDAIHDSQEFLETRLDPLLVERLGVTSDICSDSLHYGLLSCPLLLIPDPGWAKAYQLAMGGTCRLTIVPVSPDWVTFDTAWQAGVECVWLTALEKPEELHLLCFQDFNRALPLLWARPITNLVRGYQSTLWAHGGLGWPANLRLLFTPATDAATLPIQEEFLNLLAAVPLSVLGGGEEQATTPPSPDDIISGHVEFSVWQVWASYFSVEGHGAARSQVLRSTAELLDESENRAERLAAKMTTVWPKEYGSLVGPR